MNRRTLTALLVFIIIMTVMLPFAPFVTASSISLDNWASSTGYGQSGSVYISHSANAMLIIEIGMDANGCPGAQTTSMSVSGYSANFWGWLDDGQCQSSLGVWYLYRSSAGGESVYFTLSSACCDEWAVLVMSFTGVASPNPFEHSASTQTFQYGASSYQPQIYVPDTLAGRRVIMLTEIPKDHCSCSGFTYGPGQTPIDGQPQSHGLWLGASYEDSDGPLTMSESVYGGPSPWAGFADALVPAAAATVSITVTSSPTGPGYVTVDGSQVTTPYTLSWTVGSTHTLSAQSLVTCGSGCQYEWQNWSNGGSQSQTITVPSTPTTYTATFQQQYQLTMQVNPSGAATATPAIGQSWQNAGASVSIQATPISGYTFQSWSGVGSGSYSGTSNLASATMSGAITETANMYPPTSIMVTSNPTGSGYVSVDGSPITTPQSYTWNPGTTHTLAASSPVGCGSGCQYVWQSWIDNGAQSHTITVLNNSTTYAAIFQQQYSLTVSAGSGGVTTPSGTSWQNVGQQVSVSETPSSGYTFTGWILDGQNAGTQSPISVTMDQAHSLAANFAPISILCPYVNTDPPGLTPQPSQVPSCPLESGAQVTVTAQPIPDWKFENFTVTGVMFTQNDNAVTFTMSSGAVTVIAHYSSTVAPPAQGIAVPAINIPVVSLWGIGILLILLFTTKRRSMGHHR
jgi:uncharacterized repeat protein (TIGR02543 family)